MATSPSVNSAKLKSPLVLLLIAALMAAAVAWVAYYYLQQREAAMKAEIAATGKRTSTPKVSVAVPRVDVLAGAVIDGNTFVSRPVEEDLVYPDTVLAHDFPSMEGLKLAKPVLRGRPLRLSDLVAPEIKDVGAILPAGRRAFTIDIDNVNSIAQTLRPNHRIDIYLLSKGVKKPGSQEESEASLEQASLYMQDVTVLATGTEFHDVSKGDEGPATKMVRPGEVPGKEKDYDSVTLLVSPAEAARLMVGQKMGSYRIALRGNRDREEVRLGMLRGADLMPGSRKARDAGIEFIVGGSGNDKLVSQMMVPPSQDAIRALQRAAYTPPPPQAAAPPAAADPARQSITINMPASRANSAVPAYAN